MFPFKSIGFATHFLTGSLSFDKGKEKGGFSEEKEDSKKGVGPKNLFKTL